MKLKLITAVLVIIVLLSLLACTKAAPTVSVDESYAGKEVEITAGSSLVVTLESNRTTGFQWELTGITDQTVLKQDGEPEYVAPETSALGAGGQEVWTFQALKKGTSTISMAYSRPWEGGEKGVKTFDLTVVVR
jgi:inhibitor of cysteine peptidase